MHIEKLNSNIKLFNRVALSWLIFISIFTFNASAFGQEIKDRHYYAIPSHGISQFVIKQDTIRSWKCLDYAHCPTPGATSLIVKSIKRNNYNFLITRPIDNGIGDVGKFSLSILKDQIPGEYLQVVSENYLYNSITECEAAISNYKPESKIYFTFYTMDDLHNFETFRELSSLPNEEGKNVFKKLKDVMIENKPQLLNTHAGDMYGTAMLKEIANRVFIAYKINPMISEDEFDEFIKKYDL